MKPELNKSVGAIVVSKKHGTHGPKPIRYGPDVIWDPTRGSRGRGAWVRQPKSQMRRLPKPKIRTRPNFGTPSISSRPTVSYNVMVEVQKLLREVVKLLRGVQIR